MNAPLLSTPSVEAFFFDADPGTRFSLYHAPAPRRPELGAILYVHPFAEELNRSRRMASLQARQFAAMGYAVLQIDLFGCGDSCGDFSAARWDIWRRDLAAALDWLQQRSAGPVQLWGLRLGGLLALDFACSTPVDGIILWQPFLHGRTCINQFLRQRLTETEGDSTAPRSTAVLRANLAAHGSIEVAGYSLARELAQAIDACDAAAMPVPPCPIHWFASGGPAPARQAAGVARLAQRWAERDAILHYHPLDGPPFWGPAAGTECQALLAATATVFGAGQP
ncbi:hydrolase 2, exosortase A system-associated [Massilia cavernae]|uniref:Hydrolase 2, exosortase A system-associated n=1 Tax=Massilia cavernae TaxID=2320864 RepID=A0A418Y8A4_9BURK|nr:hydrolase 2, exosortase A system-associated [Massilia cavernae]RJG27627.1 hydrolase 2, exosortase A system-associated [Massilia cavernae]